MKLSYQLDDGIIQPRLRGLAKVLPNAFQLSVKERLSLMNDEEKQTAIQKIWQQLLDENSKSKPDERRIIQLLNELTIAQFGALIPEEPDFTEEEIAQFIADDCKRRAEMGKTQRGWITWLKDKIQHIKNHAPYRKDK